MSVGLSNVGIAKRPSRLTTALAAEKAEKNETDVGSQDLSELGGSLGASGVWRLGSRALAQGRQHSFTRFRAIQEAPFWPVICTIFR